MSDQEPGRIELELQRLKPAKPPDEFLIRLADALSQPRATRAEWRAVTPISTPWWRLLRWLAPAAVAAVLAAGLWLQQPSSGKHPLAQNLITVPKKTVLKADKVEIDRQLLGAFDAVTSLPSGEPVRFRCRQWMDQVVLRDSSRGVVVERRAPRLEVVPVGFDTY